MHKYFSIRLLCVAAVSLLWLGWLAQPAAGTPPHQEGRPTVAPPGGETRPTLPSGQSGGTGASGSGGAGSGLSVGGNPGESCAGFHGTAINWGFRNEPGIILRLNDGSWETTQVTAADGSYRFGPLGQGVAFLTVHPYPGLTPMIDNAAIRLRCDLDLVADLGLYSSPDRPAPPSTLAIDVPGGSILPGGTATLRLTFKNGMPHGISHVVVTDYVPDGLTVTGADTTQGTVEILEGRMVTVIVGDLPQAGQGTIQITVRADAALANGASLRNTATLFYAESAADQASVSLTVGEAGSSPTATPPPPADTPAPVAQETPTAVPAAPADTPTPAAQETPTVQPPTPAADQTPGPANVLLPVTGQGVPLALPAIGFVLILVLLGVRNLGRQPRAE